MTEPYLLDEEESEVMRRGFAAADLLASEAFTSTIRSLMFECFAQFTDSKPDQPAFREDNYQFYRGLKAIEAELQSRVQLKDALQESLDAPEDTDTI